MKMNLKPYNICIIWSIIFYTLFYFRLNLLFLFKFKVK